MRVEHAESDGVDSTQRSRPVTKIDVAATHIDLADRAERRPGWSSLPLAGVEKPSLHRIEGGDTAALLALGGGAAARPPPGSARWSGWPAASRPDGTVSAAPAADGGGPRRPRARADQHLVSRRRRRARDDGSTPGMLWVLAATSGRLQVCSMVRVPTPEEEDAKRAVPRAGGAGAGAVRSRRIVACWRPRACGRGRRCGAGARTRRPAHVRRRPLPLDLRPSWTCLRRRLVLTLERSGRSRPSATRRCC